MDIRYAAKKDISQILGLLTVVNHVHAKGRPDIFRDGQRKYGGDDLKEFIDRPSDEMTILVADENGLILGYAFCMLQDHRTEENYIPDFTMYIDDICVREDTRGKGVGKALFEAVSHLAREKGCYNVTLNVWALNPDARKFYEALGMTVQKIGMESIL